jgi:tetratricopeptide (TPR) repeat protein
MEGRLAEAERLIDDAYALGRIAVSFNAGISEAIQRFVLRREQGRLADHEEILRRRAIECPAQPRFACALAHLQVELGRAEEVRGALAGLLERTAVRADPEWLFSLVLLAEPCALAGDAASAARLRKLLLPHERAYAYSPSEAGFGSVARALGVLAACARDFDAADGHFSMALEIERRMRAWPWLAHAQRDFATTLLARGRPTDLRRAEELLDAAREGYRSLGMEHWQARCEVATTSA